MIKPATIGMVLVALPLMFASAGTVFAQVKIVVPAEHYKVEDEIRATVRNLGDRPITICVEFGQTSIKTGDVLSTPSPFWVQQYRSGKWSTLLNGPDVGSIRAPVVLEPGQSREFFDWRNPASASWRTIHEPVLAKAWQLFQAFFVRDH